MNKKETIIKISEMSGVNLTECEKVLDSFEVIFSNGLFQSGGAINAFDKIYKVMSFIKSKKDN